MSITATTELIAMPAEPVRLHPESIAELADAIATRMGAPARAVITVPEAMKLVGKNSVPAFYRWLRAQGVKPVSQGRYNRAAIERALADEAGISYRRHQITNTRRHEAKS